MNEDYSILTPVSVERFKEQKKLEKIPLDRISAMMSPMTTSSGLLFSGHLDYSRWKNCVQFAMDYFPWILGTIAGDYDNASVIPRPADAFTPPFENGQEIDLSAGYLVVEYSHRPSDHYDEKIPISEHLPKKVHEKMIRVDLAMAAIEGLPIAALKVTQYQDHFVIAYRLNHAFYDQSGIVSFFTFLSKVYTNHSDREELSLPADYPLPVFKPRAHIVPSTASFSSQEEFLASAPIGYTTAPMPPMNFGVPSSLALYFNTEKIQELKTASDLQLSTNDFLHAILLKATARYTLNLKEDDETEKGQKKKIRLFYARNMRHPLSLGLEVIGDYIRVQCLPLLLEQGLSSSLVQLAEENRRFLGESSAQKETLRQTFAKECQWMIQFPLHCPENRGLPNCDFVMDKTAVVVTNWSSFPYEEIVFGDKQSFPMELLLEGAPFMAGTGAMIRMSFRYVPGQKERQLFAIVATRYPELLKEIEGLAAETGLITTQSL